MLNKVTLIGRLGADPETRYLPNGSAVSTCSIATSRRWKDKSTNERKEQAEWHRVVFFGRLGEIVGNYCRKGSQVYVEGRLMTRKWQDKQLVDHYTTEIIADELIMLESVAKSASSHSASESAPPPMSDAPDFEDDIPF